MLYEKKFSDSERLSLISFLRASPPVKYRPLFSIALRTSACTFSSGKLYSLMR